VESQAPFTHGSRALPPPSPIVNEKLAEMYEHKQKPLISRKAFRARVVVHVLVVAVIVGVSLLVGSIGYHFLAQLSWVDSFLNASMILGGMGPVDPIRTTPAKLFAGVYALYAGFVLLISVGIIIAPVFHRLLHRFHLENVRDNRDV
jgi:hypothetical protein